MKYLYIFHFWMTKFLLFRPLNELDCSKTLYHVLLSTGQWRIILIHWAGDDIKRNTIFDLVLWTVLMGNKSIKHIPEVVLHPFSLIWLSKSFIQVFFTVSYFVVWGSILSKRKKKEKKGGVCEWKGEGINKYLHAVTDQKTLPRFVFRRAVTY